MAGTLDATADRAVPHAGADRWALSSRLERSSATFGEGVRDGVVRAALARAADTGRRGRARGCLAPDRLQRRQQPRAPAPRHAGPGAGRDPRARVLAQPG